MRRHLAVSVIASAAVLLLNGPAAAYVATGDRQFPTSLLLPQVGPGDEFYLTGQTQPQSDGGRSSFFGVFYQKTLTERLGISVTADHSWVSAPGRRTAIGWQNVIATLQYALIVDPDREFILSGSLGREFGGSGASQVGADRTSATNAGVHFAKGLGGFDIGWLRPLAIRGFQGFARSDRATRADVVTSGFSIEYSLPYLESKVAPVNLPGFLQGVTPMFELLYSKPTTGGQQGSLQIGAGFNLARDSYDISAEVLTPASRTAGRGIGFVLQVHFALDFLFPTTLGRPLF